MRGEEEEGEGAGADQILTHSRRRGRQGGGGIPIDIENDTSQGLQKAPQRAAVGSIRMDSWMRGEEEEHIMEKQYSDKDVELVLQAFAHAIDESNDEMRTEAMQLIQLYTGTTDMFESGQLFALMFGFLMGVDEGMRISDIFNAAERQSGRSGGSWTAWIDDCRKRKPMVMNEKPMVTD